MIKGKISRAFMIFLVKILRTWTAQNQLSEFMMAIHQEKKEHTLANRQGYCYPTLICSISAFCLTIPYGRISLEIYAMWFLTRSIYTEGSLVRIWRILSGG